MIRGATPPLVQMWTWARARSESTVKPEENAGKPGGKPLDPGCHLSFWIGPDRGEGHLALDATPSFWIGPDRVDGHLVRGATSHLE